MFSSPSVVLDRGLVTKREPLRRGPSPPTLRGSVERGQDHNGDWVQSIEVRRLYVSVFLSSSKGFCSLFRSRPPPR